ncbi:hypothetical protein GH714_014953 [Hevea brasiliensis]|uniref:Bulb-type lectin domain-containing protein n=1 Tax=Hevea brasiliensis TaxID=3981 RepID=A0A6A6N428_HEVBR|nr:hypothetical protein GH714_014953 [Hevea brasiliensis]
MLLGNHLLGISPLDLAVSTIKIFLLAIWYDKIPERTLVWYANGDDPAPKGSKLQLSNNGNFTLTGPQGQEIWNPKSSTDGVAYAAMLDDDGNLVLRPIGLPTDFPYPAYYKSNTDGADEMNSDYRMVFNESGDLNVFVRNGSVVNLTKSRTKSTGDYFYRATLEADGIFALYAHPRTQADGIFALYAHPRTQTNGSWGQTWYAIWSVPNDICSDMDTGIATDLGGGPCGYNSYCKLDEKRRPFCECLPGFSLSDPNNKLNGCKQNRIPNCQQDNTKPEDLYVMQELPNAYWPVSANYEQLQGLHEDDCRRLCLSDCNCMVAVIKEGTCWKKKLPLSKGRLDYNTYGKALIKVSKSDASSDEPSVGNSNVEKKDRTTLILVGAVFLGSSVFLNFLLVAAITLRGLEMESENEEEVILADWAYDCYKVKRLDKLVENDEEARNDIKRVEKLVMVAIWCQEDPSLRPSVRTVTQMLEGSMPPSLRQMRLINVSNASQLENSPLAKESLRI